MNNPAGDWGLWACLVLTETCPALHRLCNSTFLFCCHIIILWLKMEKKILWIRLLPIQPKLTLSRRSVTPRDLSNTGCPAGFPKTCAKKRGGMWRIKSAMLSLCLCECGPHSPIATNTGLKRQEGVHWEDSNSFQHVRIASSLT